MVMLHGGGQLKRGSMVMLQRSAFLMEGDWSC